MFGWSKAIKEAVTTKDVMEHLVAVMTRALEREWELRIENSELRKKIATTEDTELHGKVGGHTAVEWKETAEALQLVANRLEKEKAENSERAEVALAFSEVAERLLDELRGLLRCSAGENILEVARERMKGIENSEKENQKDAVVVEQWWSLRRILECPEGEVLIAYAEGLMASHKAMKIENGEWRRERKKLEEEKALQGENISAFQVEQEVLKSEKVALMERVEKLQAELEDLTSRKVGGVVASGEVSDLLDALGVEQGMTLRAAVHYRMGDWKRQQERLARYMERVESLKSELEMTRTQLDELQAANAAIPAVHQQVVSDLKAEHALNQDAMRQNHENELAGIRQMLEQERGLVQVAACGPWMSMDVIAPTEGMVALLEMKEGLGEDTEPVMPWRLEFGFYDASRACWWTSIGQQDVKLVQRMAVVRKGNLRAEIQEMLQVGDGEGGIKNSELRSEKEEGAEGLGEGVGNGEVRRENGEGAPVTEVPGVGKAAV